MRHFNLIIPIICMAFALSCGSGRDSGLQIGERPVVIMTTTLGTMEIELDSKKSPATVKNFLTYVNDEFYDNTLFHRAPPGVMIQGGGYTPRLQEKKTKRSIKNEADNGLRNLRGAIAMARDDNINSATSQFFINLKDNPGFDYKDATKKGFGYAVFGMVVSGMDVADRIAEALNDPGGGRMRVVIYSVRMKE